MNTAVALDEASNPNSHAPHDSAVLRAFIRPAKLCAGRTEMPCVLLGLHGNVVRTRIFAPIGERHALELELAIGRRHALELVEQTATHALLAFTDPRFAENLAEDARFLMGARRIRCRVELDALIFTGDRPAAGTIIDVSQQGVGLICNEPLKHGEVVHIHATGFERDQAIVRWAQHPRYGLDLERVLQLDELAALTSKPVRSVFGPVARRRKAEAHGSHERNRIDAA